MRSFTIIFAILLSSATAAQASPVMAVDAEAEPKDRRTEIDLGFLVGAHEIGGEQRFARGLHVNVGRRYGDLALLAEYNYLGVGRYDATGAMSRAGVVARYSLLRTSGLPDRRGKRKPVSGDFWLEGGAGVQRISWEEGGRLIRPDGVVGFGWQVNVLVGKNTPKPRYIGPYVAFRANVARAPEHGPEVMPTCGGVCDKPTKPSRNNVGLFFHVGINWGR